MQPLVIDGTKITAGRRVRLEMPVAKLYTDTDICIPVEVIRGKKDGPTLFVSAAIHGDELNGIEIIRRLIQLKTLRITNGTLIMVPMINVYGVLNQSRYMPDRRDLNRCFPGSDKGSLAARVADKFLDEIVKHCDYGIDLHTGAVHRSNLPQIRANLKDEETLSLAEKFGVPVMINSVLRDGSLREAATSMGCKVLLYEAGQALRFDELSIRAGIRGIINILGHLGMTSKRSRRKIQSPFRANTSSWIRASASGIVKNLKHLGDKVSKGEAMANIGDPFGIVLDKVRAPRSGIIIGKQNIPLVQEGDAMFHIAFFDDEPQDVQETIETMQVELLPEQERLQPTNPNDEN